MKKKGLRGLIFFLFVSALGGYALYDYYRSNERKEKEEELSRFFRESAKDVQQIRLTAPKKKPVVLKQTEGKWRMETPVRDFADFATVSSWLDKLKEQVTEQIRPEGDIQWKDYRLDKETTEAELSLKSGEKFIFSVSSRPSFDGKYFIRKGKELFMGDRFFNDEIKGKTPQSFRSLSVLHTEGHPVQLNYRGKDSFSFVWTDYKWSFKKSPSFPLNRDRLDKLWSDLSAFKVATITGKASRSALSKHGLVNPKIQMSLKFNEKDIQIRVSAPKENRVFLHVSDRDYILECSKKEAEKLILSRAELRDHGAPFKYEKDQARLFELKGKKYSFTAQKTEAGEWRSAQPAGDRQIDTEKLTAILNSLHKLKGKRYSAAPLKSSQDSLILKNEKGEVIFEMKTGQMFQPQSKGERLTWVQTSLSKGKTAVSKVSLDKIFNTNPYMITKKDDDKTSDKEKPGAEKSDGS